MTQNHILHNCRFYKKIRLTTPSFFDLFLPNFEIKCDSCGSTSPSLNQHEIHRILCGKLKCSCGKNYDTRLGFKRHLQDCETGGEQGLIELEKINRDIFDSQELRKKNQGKSFTDENSENFMKTLSQVIEQQLGTDSNSGNELSSGVVADRKSEESNARKRSRSDGNSEVIPKSATCQTGTSTNSSLLEERFDFTRDELFFRPGKGWYKLVKLTRKELNHTVEQGWTELEHTVSPPTPVQPPSLVPSPMISLPIQIQRSTASTSTHHSLIEYQDASIQHSYIPQSSNSIPTQTNFTQNTNTNNNNNLNGISQSSRIIGHGTQQNHTNIYNRHNSGGQHIFSRHNSSQNSPTISSNHAQIQHNSTNQRSLTNHQNSHSHYQNLQTRPNHQIHQNQLNNNQQHLISSRQTQQNQTQKNQTEQNQSKQYHSNQPTNHQNMQTDENYRNFATYTENDYPLNSLDASTGVEWDDLNLRSETPIFSKNVDLTPSKNGLDYASCSTQVEPERLLSSVHESSTQVEPEFFELFN